MNPNLLRVVLAWAIACSPLQGVAAVAAADKVFLNARIYTLDETRPWAEALAVRGDEIIYVGNAEGAASVIDAETSVVDVQGRLMLPGFIETHMHLGDTLAGNRSLELSPDMSKAEVLNAVADYAERFPKQDPLFGRGFLAPAFGESGPMAADLDELVADRAVFLFDEGVHSAWVNSVAMRRVGLNRDTPDPKSSAHYYKRDENGNPTGWLVERGAFFPVLDALKVIDRARLESAEQEVYTLLSSLGITALYDAGMTYGEDMTLEVLESARRQGRLPVRVVASRYVNVEELLPGAVAHVQAQHKQFNSELLDYRVLKLSLDGTVENKSAMMLAPWKGQTHNTTGPLIPKDATGRVVLEAARADMEVHLHALGDGAVRWALDMIERVRKEVPDSKSRFAMCHLQIVNPADVPRFAELDVVAQSTPSWYAYDDIALKFLGQQRFEQMYPLRSIAAEGARLTFGSDYPATWIGQDGLSPIFNIEMAITRQSPGAREDTPQPLASERVSLEQAIRAYTIDAAWQLRLEHLVGTLEVGKQADLVVLSDNLFEMDSHAIHTAKVLYTMMNGLVVYDTLEAVGSK